MPRLKSEIEVTGVRAEVDVYTYKGDTRLLELSGPLRMNTYKGSVRAGYATYGGRSYFETYKSAPRAKRYGHAHDIVEEPGLVVHSAGHMRFFTGIAYVPQLIPAGVALSQAGESTP